jgi:hypothetical protein
MDSRCAPNRLGHRYRVISAPYNFTSAGNSISDLQFSQVDGENPVKTLLSMMRIFHYVVGITAPDKKHEKQILFVWIAVFISLAAIAVLFTRFIISELIR